MAHNLTQAADLWVVKNNLFRWEEFFVGEANLLKTNSESSPTLEFNRVVAREDLSGYCERSESDAYVRSANSASRRVGCDVSRVVVQEFCDRKRINRVRRYRS